MMLSKNAKLLSAISKAFEKMQAPNSWTGGQPETLQKTTEYRSS
jgi:hypothetical protein